MCGTLRLMGETRAKVLYVYSDIWLSHTAWAVGGGKVNVVDRGVSIDRQAVAEAGVLVGRHDLYPALDVCSYAAGIFALRGRPNLDEVRFSLGDLGVYIPSFDLDDAADILKAVRRMYKALRKIRSRAPRDIWNVV